LSLDLRFPGENKLQIVVEIKGKGSFEVLHRVYSESRKDGISFYSLRGTNLSLVNRAHKRMQRSLCSTPKVNALIYDSTANF
jgi:hypothetical protein